MHLIVENAFKSPRKCEKYRISTRIFSYIKLIHWTWYTLVTRQTVDNCQIATNSEFTNLTTDGPPKSNFLTIFHGNYRRKLWKPESFQLLSIAVMRHQRYHCLMLTTGASWCWWQNLNIVAIRRNLSPTSWNWPPTSM